MKKCGSTEERLTSSEPELREGVHGVVYDKFSPLNPQMWGPARGQHTGNVGSVMFNPAVWLCNCERRARESVADGPVC